MRQRNTRVIIGTELMTEQLRNLKFSHNTINILKVQKKIQCETNCYTWHSYKKNTI